MSTLSTFLKGTHTNIQQTAAEFKTKVNNSEHTEVIVEITVTRDGTTSSHSDLILNRATPKHSVQMSIDSVSLNGELEFDLKRKVVFFSGVLLFPGQVQTQVQSVAVAVI